MAIILAVLFIGVAVTAFIHPDSPLTLVRKKKGSSQATLMGLELAIKAHRTEYFPSITLAELWESEQKAIPSKGELLKVLMAENDRLNPRKLPFYEPPALKGRFSREPRTLVNEQGELCLVDSHGNLLLLLMDMNGDGVIHNPNPGAREEEREIHAPFIIYSAGPDGDYSTWKDNLRSWEH